MISKKGPTLDDFMGLVSSRPLWAELQAAIEAQGFLASLVISEPHAAEKGGVGSEPVMSWSGWLGRKPVAVELGFVSPATLPGSLANTPEVRASPLGIWTSGRGRGEDVAAGAMAFLAWVVATGGSGYWGEPDIAAVRDLPSLKAHTESIAAASTGSMAAFAIRYPAYPKLDPGPYEIVTTVHR